MIAGYPTSTAKIEASSTGLSLSTSYAVRHSNWLVITVTIDDLGKFRKCYLELRDLPLVSVVLPRAARSTIGKCGAASSCVICHW